MTDELRNKLQASKDMAERNQLSERITFASERHQSQAKKIFQFVTEPRVDNFCLEKSSHLPVPKIMPKTFNSQNQRRKNEVFGLGFNRVVNKTWSDVRSWNSNDTSLTRRKISISQAMFQREMRSLDADSQYIRAWGQGWGSCDWFRGSKIITK